MALPYGLPQRCLQAAVVCWLISWLLSFLSRGCCLVLFAYFAVVALPAVSIYSFMNVDPSTKAVLVTGCDSGFGHALALHLHDLGFVVFAGCLMKDKGADSVKQLDDAGKDTESAVSKSFDQYQEHLSAILLSQIPPKFECCVNFFYSRAFRAFMSLEKRSFNFDGDESGDVITHCSGCDQEIDQCECNVILDICHSTNKTLAEIGILEKLSVGMIHTLILTQIQSHVQDSCVGNFSSTQIEMLEKWLQNIIFRWLGVVYGEDYIQQDQVRKNFTQFLYHAYTHTRIEQLFEIIIGYPESFPSVKDLQECLTRTQLKPIFAQSLKTTLEARLLHQGATTEDILIAYVSAIRAFSVLDPTGVLLDVACDPIKQYLRLRGDTVRHIIHSLTDSSGELGGELELGRTGTAILDEESVAAVGDTETSTDWENWLPAPSDVSDISPVVNAMTDAVIRAYPRCRYQPMALYELFKISVATHLPEYLFDAMFL